MSKRRIVVVGGGAAGFFAAITAAEANPSCEVILLEATTHTLSKVRISGGGRCNVTHACFEPKELAKRYPRGGRELLGAFHRWQPRDTIAWFAQRGVELKTEPDGRMFPVTDNSQTIVDCLRAAASAAQVDLRLQCGLASATKSPEGFQLRLSSRAELSCDRLLVATGGTKGSAGFAVAEALGHTIEPLAPSLFTFHVQDPRIEGLAGLAVSAASLHVPSSKLKERGPVLVTHWGLSGPGILRLSAWGARELQEKDYRFEVVINWSGERSVEQLRTDLAQVRAAHPRKQIAPTSHLGVPQRLWERLVSAAGIQPDAVWTTVSNAAIAVLAEQLGRGKFSVSGKSMNKEEFVTCGGVRLSEVDFRTMQSRVCSGLFFAGEVLDIDGITGGFNFQAAWTTGRLAGLAMADFSL